MLCTLAQLKARLVIGDAGHDAVLNQIAAGVSMQLATAAGRVAGGVMRLERIDLAEVLNVPDAGTRDLYVSAWPIVAVSELKEALYNAWTDADALTEDTDFVVDYARGRLTRVGYWLVGRPSVRVTYEGGYTPCDPWVTGSDYAVADVVGYLGKVYDCIKTVTARTTPPPDDATYWTARSGEVPLPEDIVEAALQQSSFTFQRRTRIGLSSESVQGASVSAYAQDRLLPGVRQTMRRYARLIG